MTIPSVVQGLIETEGGKVFELDSPKGAAWLEAIGSFRFEPSGDSKAYTVRREPSGYWYGCRKVAGKVRKKYIGKSSNVSIAKLEEIAEALEVPPVARVNQVAEVAQEVTQVAEVAQDRLTALELEMANLRKALEALQEALPGKSELGDSGELPKVDSKVTERLQNELGNLKTENEVLRQELTDARADYAKLLESSTVVTNKLREEVREVRSQLEQERADREGLQKDFDELNEKYLSGAFVAEALENKNSVAASELPEAADLLNQLKARRKKSTVSLADIEAILEMIEES
jgi:chromosome segregation ATPase